MLILIGWKLIFLPGATLTNFNDGGGGMGGGGVQQRFIFYTQKNHNFRIDRLANTCSVIFPAEFCVFVLQER